MQLKFDCIQVPIVPASKQIISWYDSPYQTSIPEQHKPSNLPANIPWNERRWQLAFHSLFAYLSLLCTKWTNRMHLQGKPPPRKCVGNLLCTIHPANSSKTLYNTNDMYQRVKINITQTYRQISYIGRVVARPIQRLSIIWRGSYLDGWPLGSMKKKYIELVVPSVVGIDVKLSGTDHRSSSDHYSHCAVEEVKEM